MKYYVAVRFKENRNDLYFGKSKKDEKQDIKFAFKAAMDYRGYNYKEFNLFTFPSEQFEGFDEFVMDLSMRFFKTKKDVHLINRQNSAIESTFEVLKKLLKYEGILKELLIYEDEKEIK